MNRARRRALVRLPAIAGAIAFAPAIRAQAFPSRPIRMLVGQAPGGQSDIIARSVAPGVAEALGVPVTVENHAGAAGTIAARMVASATPDGHVLLLGSSASLALAPMLRAEVGFDTLRDFAFIGRIARVTYVLAVHGGLRASSVEDLVRRARAEPGRLTIGTVGPGSSTALAADSFMHRAAVSLLPVPYKGGAPLVLAIRTGEVDAGFVDLSLVREHEAAGTVRVLAVLGEARVASMPRVPTLSEAGVAGVGGEPWNGLVAPAATPAPVVADLRAALRRTLAQPELRRRFDAAGYMIVDEPDDAFAAAIRADRAALAASLAAGVPSK